MSFRGRNIVVRSLVSLPDNFNLAQDVTISYIDLMEHTRIRRSELLRRQEGDIRIDFYKHDMTPFFVYRYFFLCQCPRCLAATTAVPSCKPLRSDRFAEDDDVKSVLDCGGYKKIVLGTYIPRRVM